ncbi:hypothetical protein SLEP1_g34101 [Rubroshorea leprosula]|uniref:Uncharacterized protein n=1 Tax=Rubroshorea leprosula TaxID=152421 RepID=A0AAV5KIZ7_9ROSI|nr:hypothetical protein SLEP1_g34101 [Rubroshorea leprosula]
MQNQIYAWNNAELLEVKHYLKELLQKHLTWRCDLYGVTLWKMSIQRNLRAVGFKQKDIVDEIVKKLPSSDFVVTLFHDDGAVDEWSDLDWSNKAIHVSAVNKKKKRWFAERFFHSDIVAEYKQIFLWDEDLGAEHFNLKR